MDLKQEHERALEAASVAMREGDWQRYYAAIRLAEETRWAIEDRRTDSGAESVAESVLKCVRRRSDGMTAREIGLPDGIERARNGRPVTIGEAHPLPKPKPPELAPPEGVRAVLRAVWDAMRDAPLPADAVAYLEGRALCPVVAHDAGCRVPERDAMAAAWMAAGKNREERAAAWMAAGLLRVKDGKPVPAWRMHGAEADRLWVPVWSPVWTDAPVAYRWRALWPEKRVKVCGMTTAGFEWRDWPLGVRWHESLWWGDRSAPAPVVVVCEGEPDWLTLAKALEPRAMVLGMPGTQGWRDHWWGLLSDAAAVVVAMRDDDAGKKAVVSVGAALARAIPEKDNRPLRAREAPPAGGDWNDAMQGGGAAALAPLVDLVADALRRGSESA